MNLPQIKDELFRWFFSVFRNYRFNHFPQKCSISLSPKHRYYDGSWLLKRSTPDQHRIINYLCTQELNVKEILHVGIGNSDLGKLLATKAQSIDGITVVEAEVDYAISLNIPNYQSYLINKYSIDTLSLNTKYDYIIDNNLSSYACCIAHFEQMMKQYLVLLKPNGKIITDSLGLQYFWNGFGLTLPQLKIWEQPLAFKAILIDKYIIEITKVENIEK
ncbi:MAG: hypothetical protein MUE96_08850 [Bacteroidia bacterium]|jgi:hypothetical protein|nr:hypothetical protein [Bacteroidia bacterium]